MKRVLSVLALLVFLNTGRAEPCGVSCNGGWASGTTIKGAPAGKTYVVTNRHVVALGGRAILFEGKQYPARLVAQHPTSDVALIEVSATLKCSKVAKENPVKGTKFRLQGYGNLSGGFENVREHTIAHCQGRSLSTGMFISPGDSGSGLIAADNTLVGVIWGCQGTRETGGPGLGVSASQVNELLRMVPPPAIILPQRPYRF